MQKKQTKKEQNTQSTGTTWITFGAGTGPFPHKETMYSVPLEVMQKVEQKQTKKEQNTQSESENEFVTIINKKGYLESMTMEEAIERGIFKKATIKSKRQKV